MRLSHFFRLRGHFPAFFQAYRPKTSQNRPFSTRFGQNRPYLGKNRRKPFKIGQNRRKSGNFRNIRPNTTGLGRFKADFRRFRPTTAVLAAFPSLPSDFSPIPSPFSLGCTDTPAPAVVSLQLPKTRRGRGAIVGQNRPNIAISGRF